MHLFLGITGASGAPYAARLLERAPSATVYDPNDWKAPYASGSAKVDAYVICPCSMGALGTIASCAMQNLIHRAASVAIKEERLENTLTKRWAQ